MKKTDEIRARKDELIAKFGEAGYNEMLLVKVKQHDKPGRPIVGGRKHARAMNVTDDDMDLLRELGDGNASAGLRKLLEKYRSSLSSDGSA